MAHPKEYKIERVTDMLAVPQEKWPAMLADLQGWLEMRAACQPLVDAGLMEVDPHILWVDDDIRGLSKLKIEVVESLTPTGGGSHG